MDQDHLAAARHLITFARDIEYNDTRYPPNDVKEAAAALEAYIDTAAIFPLDALTIVIEAVSEGGYQYDIYTGTPGEIESAALPREGRAVLAAVRKGGPFGYSKDGSTFGNFEGNLPKKRRGHYREFTVETPGARNRGARRIVCGGESADWGRNAPSACYYTDDHYATFSRIRE